MYVIRIFLISEIQREHFRLIQKYSNIFSKEKSNTTPRRELDRRKRFDADSTMTNKINTNSTEINTKSVPTVKILRLNIPPIKFQSLSKPGDINTFPSQSPSKILAHKDTNIIDELPEDLKFNGSPTEILTRRCSAKTNSSFNKNEFANNSESSKQVKKINDPDSKANKSLSRRASFYSGYISTIANELIGNDLSTQDREVGMTRISTRRKSLSEALPKEDDIILNSDIHDYNSIKNKRFSNKIKSKTENCSKSSFETETSDENNQERELQKISVYNVDSTKKDSKKIEPILSNINKTVPKASSVNANKHEMFNKEGGLSKSSKQSKSSNNDSLTTCKSPIVILTKEPKIVPENSPANTKIEAGTKTASEAKINLHRISQTSNRNDSDKLVSPLIAASSSKIIKSSKHDVSTKSNNTLVPVILLHPVSQNISRINTDDSTPNIDVTSSSSKVDKFSELGTSSIKDQHRSSIEPSSMVKNILAITKKRIFETDHNNCESEFKRIKSKKYKSPKDSCKPNLTKNEKEKLLSIKITQDSDSESDKPILERLEHKNKFIKELNKSLKEYKKYKKITHKTHPQPKHCLKEYSEGFRKSKRIKELLNNEKARTKKPVKNRRLKKSKTIKKYKSRKTVTKRSETSSITQRYNLKKLSIILDRNMIDIEMSTQRKIMESKMYLTQKLMTISDTDDFDTSFETGLRIETDSEDEEILNSILLSGRKRKKKVLASDDDNDIIIKRSKNVNVHKSIDFTPDENGTKLAVELDSNDMMTSDKVVKQNVNVDLIVNGVPEQDDNILSCDNDHVVIPNDSPNGGETFDNDFTDSEPEIVDEVNLNSPGEVDGIQIISKEILPKGKYNSK